MLCLPAMEPACFIHCLVVKVPGCGFHKLCLYCHGTRMLLTFLLRRFLDAGFMGVNDDKLLK